MADRNANYPEEFTQETIDELFDKAGIAVKMQVA
jgi:hypothetical protein